MKKAILPFIVGMLAVALGVFSSADTSQGAFHLMRVYGVMAGANGDANIQYVELRMTDAGQNFVSTHDICFFDAGGAPYARFTFPGNVANGADEASILVGTSEFDAAWPGTPDFIFGAGNTTAIAGGADVSHPVRGPAGKVIFGSDSATMPSLMCQASFSVIDALAYGIAYSGSVNFPPKLSPDLSAAGSQAARLVGPLCHPSSFGSPCTDTPQLDNDRDYDLLDVNTPDSNNPRNNSGVTGDISGPPPDADGDGVSDATDNCPDWPNPGQGLPNTWSVPAGDSDCDGFPNTVTSGSRGRENFMGTDAVDWCADDTVFNNERGPAFAEPLSPWPPDVNDNRQANLSDIVAYGPVFNTSPPNPSYNPRFDLNASNSVNLSDIVAFGPFFNKACLP